MNNALQNLLTRRSIRSYEDRQVDAKELELILEAGTYAPTARGTQSPLIVVVQDRETIALMSRLNAKVLGVASDPFFGAPTVLVVFADGDNANGVQDASLVMGNLMNAAHALGLGSCWINRARETFEMPEGKALMEKWGVPARYKGLGNCVLGYAKGEAPAPKPRKEGYVLRV
ncbi:MAG: diguanylate cyclase [Clostridiales bacterium]|mgnify:CR=1 FL=1|jgi:nitroreductase|nr:nitroreductase [Bacillota bacterium]NLL55098.1 diguanylate cyclase [Clostridiales bacterium]